MATGYCYFCDTPADSDPCPTCGRPVHYPEEPASPRPDSATIKAGKVEVETAARPRGLLLAVVVALLVIVVLIVIGVLGWVGVS